MLKQLIIAVLIVVAAAGTGLVVNAFRSDSLPLVQDWEKTLADRNKKSMPAEIATIDFQKMSEIYTQKGVMVLDARPRVFYEYERIPGSKSMPVDEADSLLPTFMKSLPSSITIITYCDSSSCPASKKLSRKILESGHNQVIVYVGGMLEWTQRKMPVERDEKSG